MRSWLLTDLNDGIERTIEADDVSDAMEQAQALVGEDNGLEWDDGEHLDAADGTGRTFLRWYGKEDCGDGLADRIMLDEKLA